MTAGTAFPRQTETGAIVRSELGADIAAALVLLPYAPDRYFLIDDITLTIEISRLVASRARTSGVVNANRLMQKAFQGTHPRRQPVMVKALSAHRWLVVDGNSTFINAMASGWRDLPCRIIAPDYIDRDDSRPES